MESPKKIYYTYETKLDTETILAHFSESWMLNAIS